MRTGRIVCAGPSHQSRVTSPRFGSRTGIPAHGVSALPGHESPHFNRHTMPSHFRPISLKTNDRHPNEVSHFFGPALLPCRAGFQSRRKRSSQNITLLPQAFAARRLRPGRSFGKAERRSESGSVQWDLAGGPPGTGAAGATRAEKEDSANRYAPWRDPSDVAASAATYKTRNPAQFASEKLRIKCDTVTLNFRRNSQKTNDGNPNKAKHFFEPGRAWSEAVDTDTKATAAGLKTPALRDIQKWKNRNRRSQNARLKGGRYKCNVMKTRLRWRGFPASAWGASWRRGLSCAGGSIWA